MEPTDRFPGETFTPRPRVAEQAASRSVRQDAYARFSKPEVSARSGISTKSKRSLQRDDSATAREEICHPIGKDIRRCRTFPTQRDKQVIGVFQSQSVASDPDQSALLKVALQECGPSKRHAFTVYRSLNGIGVMIEPKAAEV